MDGLKQRVIGAFVLVSLAVIFLPMIFDKPHEKSQLQVLSIPIKPEPPIVVIEQPKKPKFRVLEISQEVDAERGISEKVGVDESIEYTPVVKEEAVSHEENVEQHYSGTLTEPLPVENDDAHEIEVKQPSIPLKTQKQQEVLLDKPVVNDQPVFKNIWIVQLGVFAEHKNAYALRDKLRKAGFDGHTKQINGNEKVLVKVFSGPFVSKDRANIAKKKIDKAFSVKSIVLYLNDDS